MADERGKKRKGNGGSPAKGKVDPCAEFQADGSPCPDPRESCDECGRGTPREKDAR